MKPKIRFNEFSDEWVEKKLGDVSKIQTGSSNAQDASDEGEYPFYIRSDTVKKSNKYIFEGEAVLIPGEGRIGEIFHYANGKFDIHQRVYVIFSFQGMSGLYLLNVLRKNFGHHAAKYSVKATVDSLRLPVIQQFPIQLPTLPEQQKIGQLFSKYDAIIALYEQKLEELNALKKGLLQQMFDDGVATSHKPQATSHKPQATSHKPQATSHKPQVRFSGFNDEWVVAKLGDVLKIPEKVEAIVTNNEQLLTVKLHGGGVHEMPANKLLKLGSTKYYVRKAGQLIYGKQNFFNGSMAIIPLELDGKASSGDVPSFDIVNADAIYLYQKISQPEFYKRTEDWASGTGSKRLHEKTIQQFPIQLPTLSEQQKIGQLFKYLDARISNEQSKIEQLKAQKQGLLQRML